jgi:hypothetical protein
MILRPISVACALVMAASWGQAQQSPEAGGAPAPAAGTWKPAAEKEGPIRTAARDDLSLSADSLAPGKAPITQVNKGPGVLPNDQGQVWREYDIRPYTSRVTTTEKPEQAIIDWILRETGTEVWFSEPLGILNATKDTLRVYHTPEMQRLVLDIVDRFVSSQAESQVIGLRVVNVGNPNWRTMALSLLQPVDVKTAGIDAWLLSKENAAVLLSQLRKRTDFRENNSPNLLIHNGQTQTVGRVSPRTYVRGVRLRRDVWPGHELESGQIDEGFSLQVSPLLSLDGNTIDAVIKCQIDQVEKLNAVPVDLPSAGGGMQRIEIQVPQVVSWRLHERFRWPASQVLLLSCGVVATPTGERMGPLGLPIPMPFSPSSGRADALLFVDCKGKASQALLEAQRPSPNGPATATVPSAPNPAYHGRY